MTEIPEHLRKRAEAARAKAAASETPAADAGSSAGGEAPGDTSSESKIPAHLLERSKAAKAKADGDAPASTEVAAAGGGVTTAVAGSPRLKRIPRMPASCRRFNSASLAVGCSTATPLALGPSLAIASRVTRLSVA